MPLISISDASRAGLLAYFALAYILYEGSGAIPRESSPGRRRPSRVLADKALFVLAFAFAPVVVFAALGALGMDASLPGLGYLALPVLGAGAEAWALPTAALAALAAAVGFLAPKGEADLANYPQYLPERWGALELGAEALSWLGYLAAYEFVFRGVIFSIALPAGPLVAAAFSTALYSLAHLRKGAKESLGCLIFGAVASGLSYACGSIWPATLVHTALVLANDASCARKGRA
jgi:hypothetical protein